MQQSWRRMLQLGGGVVLGLLALGMSGAPAYSQEKGWQQRFERELALMGHRNWIVIADAAYPLQVAPGIETINTGEDQLKVVQTVLAALGDAKHVRPVIYLDAELPFVASEDATGIDAYRDALKIVLKDHAVNSLPHEQIIGKLDEAGKTFRVLVLKTNLRLPYTSVFIQLDCGYWNAAAEQRLRAAMEKAKK